MGCRRVKVKQWVVIRVHERRGVVGWLLVTELGVLEKQ